MAIRTANLQFMLPSLVRNRFQQKTFLLALTKEWRKYCSTSACALPEMTAGRKAGLPLKTVVFKLNEFAPRSLAESWDNVGLLVEPITKKDVRKILMTNDLTVDVMEEALEENADLIISYHPPIFSPLKSERIIAACLENKVAVYCPHTKLKSIKPITQSFGPDNNSKPFKVEITSEGPAATKVLQEVKDKAESISLEDIKGQIGVKADLYLTGEMGHHEVLDAVHKGTHVILCDHSNTERGFLKTFARKLSEEILERKIEVFVSKVDKDPLQIV
ncbi:NIF3-like protein 1 [Blattella germanica]|nr:NIF3-like protein 1 [Blattella germanica]